MLTALRIGSVATFLLGWEMLATARIFTPFQLPALSTVLTRLWEAASSGDLFVALAFTLMRTFSGFAIAILAGVAIGVAIARIPAVRWFLDPLVSAGLPMPKIAFLPIFMLWFGLFDFSKILMIAFSAVFPIIVETWAGTQNIDRHMSWSAYSLGAGKRGFLWEIALPAALPQVFTGIQVALPISLIVAIVCEMQMGGNGIGAMIIAEMRQANSPDVFAGILAIAATGMVLLKAMEILRRRLLVWHQEGQA